MINLKLSQFKNYQALEERLLKELGREALPEEFAMEADIEVPEAIEILNYLRDDFEIPENEDYQLIIRRGLGNNEVRKRRIKLGLRQKDLAKMVGCGKATICAIETCRQFPNKKIIKKIADVLRCDVDTLFPEWLKFIADEIKTSKMETIVEIGKLRLDNNEVLKLTVGETDINRLSNKIDGMKAFKLSKKICPIREYKVLKFRFGLEDEVPHTFEETGVEFGVTRERVRQIEAKAIERIRDKINFENLTKKYNQL